VSGDATGAREPRVLVIEDDPSVTAFLTTYLEDEGFDVRVAADGLAGLLKLHGTAPDVAVVDIMMPDVDGLRVIEQLRKENGGELPLPVVIITGSAEGARRCRELLDPADVIEKPFDPDALGTRIDAHLGRETT
jgi:DNA-binding response OmpR family regulator